MTAGEKGGDGGEIDVRGARIAADADHALALIEVPADLKRGHSKRIEVFLAPNADLEKSTANSANCASQ